MIHKNYVTKIMNRTNVGMNEVNPPMNKINL